MIHGAPSGSLGPTSRVIDTTDTASQRGGHRDFDSFTAKLGSAVSRRDVLRVLVAGLGALLASGLTGCQQLLTGSCPRPCGGACCEGSQVCVDGECVDDDVGTSGRFGPIRFSAKATSETEAQAVFFREDGENELQVFVSGEEDVVAVWKGVAVDGFGELNAEERGALDDLWTTALRPALWRVPLEVGCHFDSLPLPVYQALVFPWQLMLKYSVPDRDVHLEAAVSEATCAYVPTPDRLAAGSPSPSFPYLQASLPFPYVFSYWPFDDEGALEVSVQGLPASHDQSFMSAPLADTASARTSHLIEFDVGTLTAGVLAAKDCPAPSYKRVDHYGPSNSMCRDACGADCPSTCCESEPDHYSCEVNASRRYTGAAHTRVSYTCGTHLGCQLHDTCYDTCIEKMGECRNSKGESTIVFCRDWNTFTASCFRVCDLLAVGGFGPINAGLWAIGRGPKSDWIEYEYDIGVVRNAKTEAMCPPGECASNGSASASPLAEDDDDNDECP